jgi:hypothetical protein
MNYIDDFINFIDKNKTNKKVVINNEITLNFYYCKKECREENNDIIKWEFYIYDTKDNDNDDDIKTIIYNKKNNIYISYDENGENEHLKNHLESDKYIYETPDPQNILIFVFGFDFDFIKKINDEIDKKKQRLELMNNNFVDNFFNSCEKIGRNLYRCKTEYTEIGDVNFVTFEYDKENNKIIDNDSNTICWKVVVLYDEIDKKSNLKKKVRNYRELNFDMVTKEYTVDTTSRTYFSNISFLYPKWQETHNIIVNDKEFFLYRNRQKLEDKIFRLQTKEPKFAITTFIGANYDFLCKIF